MYICHEHPIKLKGRKEDKKACVRCLDLKARSER